MALCRTCCKGLFADTLVVIISDQDGHSKGGSVSSHPGLSSHVAMKIDVKLFAGVPTSGKACNMRGVD
jgi:hypothetical protein